MTDRELLELAATAAEIGVFWGPLNIDCYDHNKLYLKQDKVMYTAREWNPLENDGDALRLAVKLGIDVMHTNIHSPQVHAMADHEVACIEDSATDPYAATRRAIVRAAAEIGRSME